MVWPADSIMCSMSILIIIRSLCAGACLLDGSEYHGNYVDHMTLEELCDWHRPRVTKLIECGVDVLAFETIPAIVSEPIISQESFLTSQYLYYRASK